MISGAAAAAPKAPHAIVPVYASIPPVPSANSTHGTIRRPVICPMPARKPPSDSAIVTLSGSPCKASVTPAISPITQPGHTPKYTAAAIVISPAAVTPRFTYGSIIRAPPHSSISSRYPTDSRLSSVSKLLPPRMLSIARRMTGAESVPSRMVPMPKSSVAADPCHTPMIAPGSSAKPVAISGNAPFLCLSTCGESSTSTAPMSSSQRVVSPQSIRIKNAAAMPSDTGYVTSPHDAAAMPYAAHAPADTPHMSENASANPGAAPSRILPACRRIFRPVPLLYALRHAVHAAFFSRVSTSVMPVPSLAVGNHNTAIKRAKASKQRGIFREFGEKKAR